MAFEDTIINNLATELRLAAAKSEFTDRVLREMGALNMAERRVEPGMIAWTSPQKREEQKRQTDLIDLFSDPAAHVRLLRPDWLPHSRSIDIVVNYIWWYTTLISDLFCGKAAEIEFGDKEPYLNEYAKNEAELPVYMSEWVPSAVLLGYLPLQVVKRDNIVDIIKVDQRNVWYRFTEGREGDFDWVAKKVYVDPKQVIDPRGKWEYNKDKRHDGCDGVVFEERHYRGFIYYFLYVVKGDYIAELLPPHWYDSSLPGYDEDGYCKVCTEFDGMLLNIVPTYLFHGKMISEAGSLLGLQTALNTAYTRINRVNNVFSSPKLVLPDTLIQLDYRTGEGLATALKHDVLFMSAEENRNAVAPQYLTWDAQLDYAYKEIVSLVNAMCTITQISPSFVVQENSAFPESAAAYRLKLTPTLNRVERMKTQFVRYLKRVLYAWAVKLKQVQLPRVATLANPDLLKVDFANINVSLVPALPQDDRFLVERMQGGPSVSLYRVLSEVDGMTDEEAADEEKKIRRDQQALDEGRNVIGGVGFGSPVEDGIGNSATPEIDTGGIGQDGPAPSLAGVGSAVT